MFGKSKASDRTNLCTGAAPLIVSTILCCEALVYNSFFFSEQPFYENYPALDSHTRPFTRQDGFQNRHIKGLYCTAVRKLDF